jgi:acyl-CoA thioesterase
MNPGEWRLYDQHSTTAADGRGFNEGEVYHQDGLIIMSRAKESMLWNMSEVP